MLKMASRRYVVKEGSVALGQIQATAYMPCGSAVRHPSFGPIWSGSIPPPPVLPIRVGRDERSRRSVAAYAKTPSLNLFWGKRNHGLLHRSSTRIHVRLTLVPPS